MQQCDAEHNIYNTTTGSCEFYAMPRRTATQIIHRSLSLCALSLPPFFFTRWVLYEKPNFKGEKIALDEGDIELTYPFNPPEEQLQNGQKEGGEQNGEQNGETGDAQTETKPARRFIIGSVRRAVRVRQVVVFGCCQK